MGERGPKANQEFGDQRAVLSTRITQETRDALEAAATASGRPLSREVEHRLRRSFDTDTIVETLGGPQLYAMLRLVSAAMLMAGTGRVNAARRKALQKTDWLNDPDAYAEAVKATLQVLHALRPAGSPTGHLRDKGLDGLFMANLVLDAVEEATPTQPSPGEKLDNAQLVLRRVASGLGPLHERLKDNG